MRYCSKLLILLAAVMTLSIGTAILLLDAGAKEILWQQMRAKGLSIAATASVLIDGGLHREIRSREDETGAAYKLLREQLRRVREANRRQDTWLQYVYTLMPSPERPEVMVFAVDAEEKFEDKSHVGDVVRAVETRSLRLGECGASEKVVADEWGRWLTAYAPIRDGNGKPIAILGVDIPASEIILGESFVQWDGMVALGIGLVIALISALLISRLVSRPLTALRRGIEEIGRGNFDVSIPIGSRDEFGEIGGAVSRMARGLKEREMVKSAFARYVSHQVLDSILSKGEVPGVHGERRKVTVLFCDLRDFTSLSEKLRPEDVVTILNEYFEKVVEIIFRNQGTLDKFIGDGLMALFGAPVEDPYQEEHAVRAASEMQQELDSLSKKWERLYGVGTRAGIGISSGNAIVGNIGSSQRMDYTAIGDTVNLASRLESATKDLKVNVLVSEHTYDGVRGAFPLTRLGPITVKGRKEPVVAYSL